MDCVSAAEDAGTAAGTWAKLSATKKTSSGRMRLKEIAFIGREVAEIGGGLGSVEMDEASRRGDGFLLLRGSTAKAAVLREAAALVGNGVAANAGSSMTR